MINAKLQNIIDTKSAIGNAIVNKGGTITGETPFFNYAAEINNISTGSVLTGNATTNVVFNGFTFYGNDANTQLTGTFVFDGNATVGNVESGKTFFATNGTKLTGTLVASASIDGYDESIMLQLLRSTPILPATSRALAINNSFVYIGGFQSPDHTIKKYHEGNLVFIENSANINAGPIGSIIINNGFIFASTSTNNLVRKYHESNLAFVANTANYGGDIETIKINNSFLYVAGRGTERVRKYHEGNLAFVGNTSLNAGQIYAMDIANGFIFTGGTATVGTNRGISKFHEGNLAFISNSVNYSTGGGFILALAADNNFVYVGGGAVTNCIVQKFNASTLALVNNSPLLDIPFLNQIDSLALSNNEVFVGGTTKEITKLSKSNLSIVGKTPILFTGNITSLAINNSFIYAVGEYPAQVIGKYYTSTPFSNNINGANYYLIPK
jgi:hypothetical protein